MLGGIKMKKCSLAVDIGASSGCIIAGFIEEGKLKTEEIHRFPNKMERKNNYLTWNVEGLFSEIVKGIHKCREKNFEPVSIGVDTWAVDFVLLDENDELLTDAVSYRDPRTDGIMEEVFAIISKEELYDITGIQFQKFNTIYQLYYLKTRHPEVMRKAKTFLMLPDYLHFLLTGVKSNEYTNATSTQLFNATTNTWDDKIIDSLGFNREMFLPVQLPKTKLGNLRPELVEEFGFDMEVILPATHDTASAVVAVPYVKDTIYISSGTWSLIGVENHESIHTKEALQYNFTNEGGFDYRFRFIKNIMGLWVIQEVKRLYNDQYSYDDFTKLANQETDFHSIIDVNDGRFYKPKNMIEEIQAYCEETNQAVPKTPGQIAKCVFDSLSKIYVKAIEEIEEVNQKTYRKINVIGGGSQNEMLNQLIADASNKEVFAGPVEATAIGNIVSQLIALEQLSGLDEARKMIRDSFEIKTYNSKVGGTL